MLRRLRSLTFIRSVLSILFLTLFSAFAFGQATQAVAEVRQYSPWEVIGWIAITGAGIAHIATNVFNLVRRSNYEQLKEACSTYKELAESRKAQIAELARKNTDLELENEKMLELALRAGAKPKGEI